MLPMGVWIGTTNLEDNFETCIKGLKMYSLAKIFLLGVYLKEPFKNAYKDLVMRLETIQMSKNRELLNKLCVSKGKEESTRHLEMLISFENPV